MALTPLDIRKTEFTRRLRGLDPDEVAAYLELLAREFEGMQHEAQLRDERVRELENRIQHYERIELALEEALRTTRESSRQAVEAAHQKADQIRAEAAREAERVTSQAEQEHTRLRQEAQAIAVRRKEIVARLRAFLMSEMEVLAHFEGEDPVGFIKLMPQAEALLGQRASEHSLGQGPEADERTPAPTAEAETWPEPADEGAAAGSPVEPSPWPLADHPTPPPDPFEAQPGDTTPDAAAYPPEVEAYFQSLDPAPDVAPGDPAQAGEEAAWAPAGAGWPTDEVTDTLPDVPAHAHEPGEAPVPEDAFGAPSAWSGENAWPDEVVAPEASSEHAAPAFEIYEPGAEEAPEAAAFDAAELPAPVAEPAVRDAGPAGPGAAAPRFEVRAVHRERYRIETLVGPATALPEPPPDADVSEESEHIRRLLDGLD